MNGTRGGPRPGAGRKAGGKNRGTIERELRAAHGVEAAIETGLLPLDVMLARMRDEPLPNGQRPTDSQFEAACAAAPYIHPRLAAATLKAMVAPSAALLPIDADSLTDHQRRVLRDILLLGPPAVA